MCALAQSRSPKKLSKEQQEIFWQKIDDECKSRPRSRHRLFRSLSRRSFYPLKKPGSMPNLRHSRSFSLNVEAPLLYQSINERNRHKSPCSGGFDTFGREYFNSPVTKLKKPAPQTMSVHTTLATAYNSLSISSPGSGTEVLCTSSQCSPLSADVTDKSSIYQCVSSPRSVTSSLTPHSKSMSGLHQATASGPWSTRNPDDSPESQFSEDITIRAKQRVPILYDTSNTGAEYARKGPTEFGLTGCVEITEFFPVEEKVTLETSNVKPRKLSFGKFIKKMLGGISNRSIQIPQANKVASIPTTTHDHKSSRGTGLRLASKISMASLRRWPPKPVLQSTQTELFQETAVTPFMVWDTHQHLDLPAFEATGNRHGSSTLRLVTTEERGQGRFSRGSCSLSDGFIATGLGIQC